MKRWWPIIVGVLAILGGTFYIAQAAGCTPFLVASGGTGVCNFITGRIPFGNGTGAVASSSALTFTTASAKLTVTNASTTALTSGFGYFTTASTTNLTVSGLGNTGTNCLQISNQGVVSATGSGCSGGAVSLISTSTGLSISQVPYYTSTSPTNIGGVGTTTLAGSGVVSISNAPFVLSQSGSAAVATLTGGTNGQILGWIGGVPTWLASTTFSGTAPITVTFLNGLQTIACATCLTANQSITLTGAVTGTGATSITTAFGNLNANSVLGVKAGAAGVPTSLATSSELFTGTTGQLPIFTATNSLAGTSTLFITTAGLVGISSTTPFATLGVNPKAGDANQFAIGSSTGTSFIINPNGNVGIGTTTPFTKFTTANGAILNPENCNNTISTSTSQTVNWSTGCTQQMFKYGTAGITVTFTGAVNGQTLRMITCAPDNGTMGTITWPAGMRWAGGTLPTQTTTAQHCDVYSFIATQATSTTAGATTYFGAQSANF